MPCRVRRYAASVIIAAGEDPRSYDMLRPGGAAPTNGTIRGTEKQSSPPPATSALTLPNYIGYHLGGRNRPVVRDGFAYDRTADDDHPSGLYPVAQPKLGEDRGDVNLHGPLAQM